MEKGEIYWAKDREIHPHPIVYMGKYSDYSFCAAVLSSKPDNTGRKIDNIPMKAEHFYKNDVNGEKYPICFKDTSGKKTCVIDYNFEKEIAWIDTSSCIGKLTPKGIEFVEKIIKQYEPQKIKGPIYNY